MQRFDPFLYKWSIEMMNPISGFTVAG